MVRKERGFHLLVLIGLLAVPAWANLPAWSYDPGPNPHDPMERELIDINADIPDMPALSTAVANGQKFRLNFGPVLWRLRTTANAIKILFVGQDATHIAEAAGRTATAGFGGRAQDFARYFGVNESAGFINAFAFTIFGQYGAYNTPFSEQGTADEPFLNLSNLVPNPLWLLSMDQDSPITQWRNRLLDWIIRQNREKLQLIVFFGAAAQDAAAAYIESAGGKVETHHREQTMSGINVPEVDVVGGGSNNEFPVPRNSKGQDVHKLVVGRDLKYGDRFSGEKDKAAALKAMEEQGSEYLEQMYFSERGPYENGLLHAAQLGGYDLKSIRFGKGARTVSLNGLKLSDGTVLDREKGKELLVVQLPHPSSLSKSKDPSGTVKRHLEILESFSRRDKKPWVIPEDPEQVNDYALGNDYVYGRTEIGPEFYDFGAPGTRMVPVSTASRLPGNPHIIIFGSREPIRFDLPEEKAALERMTADTSSEKIPAQQMYTARPRTPETRYTFDPGPGEALAKLMKESLPDPKRLYKTKKGKSWKENGIEAFYVKTHPDIGDFGHYRGKFKKPRVVILADPHGNDDLITARALTGTRGQYLNGLMRDLGVGDQYLVIKTVPYGMDGATPEDWAYVLQATAGYRQALLGYVFANTTPELVLTDGKYAAQVVEEFSDAISADVVNLQRGGGRNLLEAAAKKIVKLKAFKGRRPTLERVDIPRSHLSYYARVWEGTSGDRILNSTDIKKRAAIAAAREALAADPENADLQENLTKALKLPWARGLAFAEVAPLWAWSQERELDRDAKAAVRKLRNKLDKYGLRRPGETVPEYRRRVEGKNQPAEADSEEPVAWIRAAILKVA